MILLFLPKLAHALRECYPDLVQYVCFSACSSPLTVSFEEAPAKGNSAYDGCAGIEASDTTTAPIIVLAPNDDHQKDRRHDEVQEADPRVPGPRVEYLGDPVVDHFDPLALGDLDGPGTRLCDASHAHRKLAPMYGGQRRALHRQLDHTLLLGDGVQRIGSGSIGEPIREYGHGAKTTN